MVCGGMLAKGSFTWKVTEFVVECLLNSLALERLNYSVLVFAK